MTGKILTRHTYSGISQYANTRICNKPCSVLMSTQLASDKSLSAIQWLCVGPFQHTTAATKAFWLQDQQCNRIVEVLGATDWSKHFFLHFITSLLCIAVLTLCKWPFGHSTRAWSVLFLIFSGGLKWNWWDSGEFSQ